MGRLFGELPLEHFERVVERTRGAVAVLRLLGERTRHDFVQLPGYVAAKVRNQWRRSANDLHDQLRDLSFERKTAGNEFEQGHAEAVDVTRRQEPTLEELLGRHISDRPPERGARK